ncbi:MAG: methionyl-tRNA formyltransferase [Rhizobacter sp.]|nr:methionyl-tRNA formyltransferase [Rhizobacter sp.]
MRIAFAGTPAFARAALEALHAAGHEITLVLTQPDRPAGRGMKLTASPVKAFALANGLAIAQPRGLKLDGRFAEDAAAARDALLRSQPEAIVVAAYGLILPPWLLDMPRLGCLNIHASLLPRWRGAAPIQRAIEAGDKQTGITVMQMDAGLDTGDMLLTQAIQITAEDTAATLHDRLATLGASLIVEALHLAARGTLRRSPQPDAGVTYAHKIDKREAAVDWTLPAAVLERRLRAFDPFPGATSEFEGEAIKLWRARVVDGHGRPGVILAADDAGIVVACGVGALGILALQRPGGRRATAAQFLAGRRIEPGAQFGARD